MDRKPLHLLSLFAAAAFSATRNHFGGIPLQRLSNQARRQYKREYTGSHGTTSFKGARGHRQAVRALRFKEKHGHFATEC